MTVQRKENDLSPEKVIEMLQNIYQIGIKNPMNGEVITKNILLTEEHQNLQKLFSF